MENVKNIENVKNVNENLEEMSEEKINLITDYTPVIKTIKIVPTTTKYGTVYHAVVDVAGMHTLKVRIDENFANYINLCGKLNIKPFKVKTVVKELSTEKNRQFVCLKFVTIKDNVYRFFIDRSDVESIELIYEQSNLVAKK